MYVGHFCLLSLLAAGGGFFVLFWLANVGEGKGPPAQHSSSPWMNDNIL